MMMFRQAGGIGVDSDSRERARQCEPASDASGAGDVFYGGTIGVGFGDVDYLELSPLVGKHLNPKVSVGGSLIYRYRSDDRYEQDLSTHDYGASVFGQYHLTPRLFAQAEHEYLNDEHYKLNLDKDCDTTDGCFLGGGARGDSVLVASNARRLFAHVWHTMPHRRLAQSPGTPAAVDDPVPDSGEFARALALAEPGGDVHPGFAVIRCRQFLGGFFRTSLAVAQVAASFANAFEHTPRKELLSFHRQQRVHD
jgi:hypothetical protein